MRWWHRWRHGQPNLGTVYPPKKFWQPRMLVMRDAICPCGRFWVDQYTVKQSKKGK
jgi:hypothetical protein